jgi:dUTPase
VKFEVSDERFLPEEKGAYYDLKAKPYTADPQVPAAINLPPRRLSVVSTGLTVEVQEGFKLCFSVSERIAKQGGILADMGHITNGELFVTVFNCGTNIIPIKIGDVIAKCWMEPIHQFDWTEGLD